MKITTIILAAVLMFSTFLVKAETDNNSVYYISYKLLDKKTKTVEEGAMSSIINVPINLEKYNYVPYVYASKSDGKFDYPIMTEKVFSNVKNGYTLVMDIQEVNKDSLTISYGLSISLLNKLHEVKIDDGTIMKLPSVENFTFTNKVATPIGKYFTLINDNNYEFTVKITQ